MRPLKDICITNLIKALTIMREFETPEFGVHCRYDILVICGLDLERLKENSKKVERLDKLGFSIDEPFSNDDEYLCSFAYGSA